MNRDEFPDTSGPKQEILPEADKYKQMKRLILKIPVIGTIILFMYRFTIGFAYIRTTFTMFIKWLFVSKETTNFSYHLDEMNILYLTHFIAEITGKSFSEIKGYMNEIENDLSLKKHITDITESSSERYKSDKEPRFARRIAWYAIVRSIKPKTIIETGVEKGLGSVIITAALIKNYEEGFKGKYYGTDINPKAGYLFKPPYSEFGEILYGDSIESLKKLQIDTIDLFINDSDHSSEYEQKEYETIKFKLTDNSIIIGDNSHITTKLQIFAKATNRRFLFFKENPKDHWYQGAGIGIAFNRKDDKTKADYYNG